MTQENVNNFIEKATKKFSGRYIYPTDVKSYGYYKTTPITIKDTLTNTTFSQTPANHMKSHTGNPLTASNTKNTFKSELEDRVEFFLKQNNIEFEAQVLVRNIAQIESLSASVDFVISDKKIAIEYQGEQHYTNIKYFGEYKLARQLELDRKKAVALYNAGYSVIYISKIDYPEVFVCRNDIITYLTIDKLESLLSLISSISSPSKKVTIEESFNDIPSNFLPSYSEEDKNSILREFLETKNKLTVIAKNHPGYSTYDISYILKEFGYTHEQILIRTKKANPIVAFKDNKIALVFKSQTNAMKYFGVKINYARNFSMNDTFKTHGYTFEKYSSLNKEEKELANSMLMEKYGFVA